MVNRQGEQRRGNGCTTTDVMGASSDELGDLRKGPPARRRKHIYRATAARGDLSEPTSVPAVAPHSVHPRADHRAPTHERASASGARPPITHQKNG